MGSSWIIGWTLYSITNILIIRREDKQKGEDNMEKEAEKGVMDLQAKEHQEMPTATSTQ